MPRKGRQRQRSHRGYSYPEKNFAKFHQNLRVLDCAGYSA
jgi:hypothetical protein